MHSYTTRLFFCDALLPAGTEPFPLRLRPTFIGIGLEQKLPKYNKVPSVVTEYRLGNIFSPIRFLRCSSAINKPPIKSLLWDHLGKNLGSWSIPNHHLWKWSWANLIIRYSVQPPLWKTNLPRNSKLRPCHDWISNLCTLFSIDEVAQCSKNG